MSSLKIVLKHTFNKNIYNTIIQEYFIKDIGNSIKNHKIYCKNYSENENQLYIYTIFDMNNIHIWNKYYDSDYHILIKKYDNIIKLHNIKHIYEIVNDDFPFLL